MSEERMKAQVRFSDVDISLNLSYLSLSCLVQDATTAWLREHRLNNDWLHERYHVILVVAKSRMETRKRIPLGTELCFSVSLVKKNVASFVLNTEVMEKETGLIFADSFIEICAMDDEKRCLFPVGELPEVEALTIEKEKQVTLSRRFFSNGESDAQKVMRVESTDIDYSHHLNNTAYWRFVFSFFTSDQLSSLSFQTFEIQYVKEAYEGISFSISRYQVENGWIFVFTNGETTICKAKITLKA